MLILIEAATLGILFVLNVLFSAAETAMTALPRLTVKRLMDEHFRLAGTLEAWLANPGKMLTTIIVSSNLSVIAFSFVASALTSQLVTEEHNLVRIIFSWLGSALVSVVVLLLAEITPKVLAKRRSEKVALLVMPVLQVVEHFLGPLVRFLLKFISMITWPFGNISLDEIPVMTEDDLRQMVSEGEKGGVLEKEEREMIHSIIEFGDTLVKEVMIPRTDMACVRLDSSVDECLDTLIEGGYSRMPVYKDHFDNIVGILYSKDFLSVMKDRDLIILQDVIRPAYYVPETKKVSDLLREFKRGRIHMAIVVDEFGGTAGLATLEDLLEEIVGEIRDEYDTEERLIELFADGSAIVEARASLRELNGELKLDLPEGHEKSTIGGFVSDIAQRVPKRGETVHYKNVSFYIMEGNSRKVMKIRVKKESGKPSEETDRGGSGNLSENRAA